MKPIIMNGHGANDICIMSKSTVPDLIRICVDNGSEAICTTVKLSELERAVKKIKGE